jgi:hypothetical protein
MRAKTALAVGFVGLALALTGCLGSADQQKVTDAQNKFFAQLAAKQYAQIYADAAPELQQSVNEADFEQTLVSFDNAVGACQAPQKKLEFNTNENSNGVFQDQGFTQKCANATVDETLSIVLRNGEVKVEGFKYNSHPNSNG